MLEAVADENGFSLDTPWKKLKKNDQKVVLYGAGKSTGAGQVPQPLRPQARRTAPGTRASSRGSSAATPEADSDRTREQIEGYMREVPCPACQGAGCEPESLAVTIGERNIAEVGNLSIRKAAEFFRQGRAHRRASS